MAKMGQTRTGWKMTFTSIIGSERGGGEEEESEGKEKGRTE